MFMRTKSEETTIPAANVLLSSSVSLRNTASVKARARAKAANMGIARKKVRSREVRRSLNCGWLV